MLDFQELEKANEIETKREMKTKRLAMTDTLWDITKYYSFFYLLQFYSIFLWLMKARVKNFQFSEEWRFSIKRIGQQRLQQAWKNLKNNL